MGSTWRRESWRRVRACRLDTHVKSPYVVFSFVIVLILGLAWVWGSAGQQRAARYTAPEESAGAAPEPRRTVAVVLLVPPPGLPCHRDIGAGIETSTREVTSG